ncbi:MAG: hypothetical protein KatS3mg131_0238 [Candidatus Tectimicrobiota bacterium]|nr:MAG: hypothetical protein KatS3mg131_0238 [Candidatus Tectomicrobia bacterium]
MEAVKLFEKKDVPLDWEYDGEADTLYLSFGPPRAAIGIDVGDGVIVRYDEQAPRGRRLDHHWHRPTP